MNRLVPTPMLVVAKPMKIHAHSLYTIIIGLMLPVLLIGILLEHRGIRYAGIAMLLVWFSAFVAVVLYLTVKKYEDEQ